MAAFEISVNGERRFVGQDVRAITMAADRLTRGNADRVSVHVGVGEDEVQYLGADLAPGDEIVIRVLEPDELSTQEGGPPESCSFCGNDKVLVNSLVAGLRIAICDGCLLAFHAVITRSAALPIGASIEDQGDTRCGFCQKGRPDVAGLLVRNAVALCPECLRACMEMTMSPLE